ncbi:MAG TPA: serine hydrolase domain-containing protein [Cyclobacteriaceae bacterium]|nr:serine hydrolase domain-containing protein [Cyclobacteriaceae bacterium]
MKLTSLKFLFSFLLIALMLSAHAQQLPAAKPEAVGMSTERLKRFDAVFQKYVDDKRMAGSVTLVMRKGKVVYHEAFGYRDIASKSPMTRDAIFRIASQSKALISVGIMILQEEGKLLIGDPLSKYIPEFKSTTVAVLKDGGGYEVVPARREITLRDLLTHTAGIGYGEGVAADKWKQAGIQGWYFANRNEPIAATVARMAALPNDAQPGEKWVYGYNTDILGVVIEKASGIPLDQFIKTKITDPLGMVDTYFYLPKEKTSRFTTTYALESGVLKRSPDESSMSGQGEYVDGPRKSFSGGAGLLSTATDYARFLQMLLNGGELNGMRILSPKSVELMTVSHTALIGFRPGEGFGLGFSVVTDVGTRGVPGSIGEYGWGGAYGSSYWVDPKEELIVVYFKQLRPSDGLDDQQKLRTLIYQAIVE